MQSFVSLEFLIPQFRLTQHFSLGNRNFCVFQLKTHALYDQWMHLSQPPNHLYCFCSGVCWGIDISARCGLTMAVRWSNSQTGVIWSYLCLHKCSWVGLVTQWDGAVMTPLFFCLFFKWGDSVMMLQAWQCWLVRIDLWAVTLPFELYPRHNSLLN